MRPLRIQIFNLGAIPFADIDLTEVTVAAIAGPNGAGKSTAFTTAPRWALYGVTKLGTKIDDMVRVGTTEASVIFDFEHQGGIYRVTRTRSTKGKGKSTLELQKEVGDQWDPQSGNSIDETQRKIIDLLGLDDETFVASSMILQGDAGNFTKRPAGQRKAILAQVLQLDQYEVLQEKAKAKAQIINVELEKGKSKIADIAYRLLSKPGYIADKLQGEARLVEIANDLKLYEVDLQTAQVEHSALIAKIQQAEEIGRQAKGFAAEVGQKTIERDILRARVNTADNLLSLEPSILEAVATYERIRDEVTVLRTKKGQQENIFAEGNRLKEELSGVDLALANTQREITALQANLADRPKLEAADQKYIKAVADLAIAEDKRTEHSRLSLELTKAQSELTVAETNRANGKTSREREIKALQAKTAMLADANCIDIEKAECKFLADAKAARADLILLEEQLEEWENNSRIIISVQNELVDDVKLSIENLGFNSEEYARLNKSIAELKPQADLYAKLDGMITLLDNYNTQLSDLVKRQTDINNRLVVAREQYGQLGEELKLLPQLETQMGELFPQLERKERLPAAREIVTTGEANIKKLTIEIETASTQAEKLQKEYEALIGDSAALKLAAENKVNTLQTTIETIRKEHTDLVGNIGGLTAKLDVLAQDDEQRVILIREMEPLAKELVRWQTLVKAFSRDGIPALIIENAVPELERIANDILGQMSGGKNYLRFETQRELKSRSGMAETLDIIVGDWAGERIYETYSGGEMLRIDFAIRFALAELLAKRAGAKVDWLTIDEGFGSQSEEFLPMVIDAVKSVAHRFGIVLVISHVRAVQEAFDQKIMFKPSDEVVEALVA